MLDIVEIQELESVLRNELNEHLEQILIKLNHSGQLVDFLKLINMSSLLGDSYGNNVPQDGKIVVIGQSDTTKERLIAVTKKLGLDKNRFEFYLEYEDAKSFNFGKMQWSDKYSAVLVGPMPHSGTSKGDYGSVISAMEQQEGYPPVVRMGNDELKITKNSFEKALIMLINKNVIA